jgi:hypothetical protein
MLVLLPSFRTKEGAAAQALKSCQTAYAIGPIFMQQLHNASVIFRLRTLSRMFNGEFIHRFCQQRLYGWSHETIPVIARLPARLL